MLLREIRDGQVSFSKLLIGIETLGCPFFSLVIISDFGGGPGAKAFWESSPHHGMFFRKCMQDSRVPWSQTVDGCKSFHAATNCYRNSVKDGCSQVPCFVPRSNFQAIVGIRWQDPTVVFLHLAFSGSQYSTGRQNKDISLLLGNHLVSILKSFGTVEWGQQQQQRSLAT